jgi:hypothetical protein
VSTLLLSTAACPVPDIVALGATLTADGIVNVPGPLGTGVFAVSTVNVGAEGVITVNGDTGGMSQPVTILVCQTNPSNGQCVNPTVPGPSATVHINANETPTFSAFIIGNGSVPFSPGVNRAFIRFKTETGVTVGATSAALRTVTP